MIGEIIRKKIEASGKSTKDVAGQLKISDQNLYKIYKKKSVETRYIIDLAKILNISISEFFPGESIENQAAIAERYNSNIFLLKYFKKIEQLKKSDLPEDIKIVHIKRIEYIKNHLVKLSHVEMIINLIEETEDTLQDSSEELTIDYLKVYFGGRFPIIGSEKELKEIVDLGLIYNRHLETYLRMLIR